MIIDYISDLHIDYDNIELTNVSIKEYINSLGPKGEILIIAGDIHEDNEKLIKFLKLVLEVSNYQKIYFVAGNHELYGFDFSSYKEKIKDLSNKVSKNPSIFFLDGQVEEYKGVKIGGCMMWYDGMYSKYFDQESQEDLNELWNDYMPDSRNIAGMTHFDQAFEEELLKLKEVYKSSDIIVTHIPPLCHPDFVAERFRYSMASSFYSFYGFEYIENMSAKHWVFGHVHTPIEVDMEGRYLHCNPKGYETEAISAKMKQIEIEVN